jgi:hypothetical protein
VSAFPSTGVIRRQSPIPSPPRPYPLIEPTDLLDVAAPIGMLEIEQWIEPPVEVKGDVRDLLVELVGRVRHDSPRRPPATSTAKEC